MREKTPIVNYLRDSEEGSSLVVVICVVMIVVMSLIGITGMQTTTLQEKMAGNLRDRDLAFQAAEAALREAELYLQAASLPAFDGTGGLYQPPDPVTVYLPRWATVDWSVAGASRQYGATIGLITYGSTIQGVAAQPRYIIEELPHIEVVGESARFGALPDVALFRVTARGTGGTQNAVAILQGTFRR